MPLASLMTTFAHGFTSSADRVSASGTACQPQLLLPACVDLQPAHLQDGQGTGNTALVYHAQKLLTLHEGDLPYHLRSLCNGVIETMGRVDYGGRLKRNFTAHPKVDPETGEHLGSVPVAGQGKRYHGNPRGATEAGSQPDDVVCPEMDTKLWSERDRKKVVHGPGMHGHCNC